VNIGANLGEVFAIIEALGKDVAPSETAAANDTVKAAAKLITLVAHPNTLAYKWATATLGWVP
jgi:hypothetical protein